MSQFVHHYSVADQNMRYLIVNDELFISLYNNYPDKNSLEFHDLAPLTKVKICGKFRKYS